MKLQKFLVILAGLLFFVPAVEARHYYAKKHRPVHKAHHISVLVRPAYPLQSNVCVSELRARHLVLPIEATNPEDWKNSFFSMRGNQYHHAVDMSAPASTPIRAVQDGVIARLSSGGRGGTSIYLADVEGKFNFLYCHLNNYAPGLRVGQNVRRGEVIGFVGSTGHASGPHLHFEISSITDRTRLWAGVRINPYLVFSHPIDSDIRTIASTATLFPRTRLIATFPKKGIGLGAVARADVGNKERISSQSTKMARVDTGHRGPSPAGSMVATTGVGSRHQRVAQIAMGNRTRSMRNMARGSSHRSFVASSIVQNGSRFERVGRTRSARTIASAVHLPARCRNSNLRISRVTVVNRQRLLAHHGVQRANWLKHVSGNGRHAIAYRTTISHRKSNMSIAYSNRKARRLALRRNGQAIRT